MCQLTRLTAYIFAGMAQKFCGGLWLSPFHSGFKVSTFITGYRSHQFTAVSQGTSQLIQTQQWTRWKSFVIHVSLLTCCQKCLQLECQWPPNLSLHSKNNKTSHPDAREKLLLVIIIIVVVVVAVAVNCHYYKYQSSLVNSSFSSVL